MKNDDHDYRKVTYQNKIKDGMIMYLFATIHVCLIWKLNYVQHNKNLYEKIWGDSTDHSYWRIHVEDGLHPPPPENPQHVQSWAIGNLSNRDIGRTQFSLANPLIGVPCIQHIAV